MGSIILFSVAVLTYYCMMLLVLTRRRLETPHVFSKIASFGDLGFAVYGSISRLSVDVMIVLAHAGFCISYLIFIGNTLVYVFNNSEESYSHKILGFFTPKFLYIWGCFPFLLRLNSIPTLIHLAPLSIFADVVDLGAIGVVRVGMILPLESEAKDQSHGTHRGASLGGNNSQSLLIFVVAFVIDFSASKFGLFFLSYGKHIAFYVIAAVEAPIVFKGSSPACIYE
ncbi:hypothetical protein ACOSQ2_019806 [Xanthoceras sorbifolium]